MGKEVWGKKDKSFLTNINKNPQAQQTPQRSYCKDDILFHKWTRPLPDSRRARASVHGQSEHPCHPEGRWCGPWVYRLGWGWAWSPPSAFLTSWWTTESGSLPGRLLYAAAAWWLDPQFSNCTWTIFSFALFLKCTWCIKTQILFPSESYSKLLFHAWICMIPNGVVVHFLIKFSGWQQHGISQQNLGPSAAD